MEQFWGHISFLLLMEGRCNKHQIVVTQIRTDLDIHVSQKTLQ
jgi:hypothetical protein